MTIAFSEQEQFDDGEPPADAAFSPAVDNV
jgi:hypothetical protein